MGALRRRYGQARARAQISPDKVRSFGVLAGAYAGKRGPRAGDALLHACEVDEQGYPVRVLCSRVKIDHIMPDFDYPEPPTCPICARRDPRAA